MQQANKGKCRKKEQLVQFSSGSLLLQDWKRQNGPIFIKINIAGWSGGRQNGPGFIRIINIAGWGRQNGPMFIRIINIAGWGRQNGPGFFRIMSIIG